VGRVVVVDHVHVVWNGVNREHVSVTLEEVVAAAQLEDLLIGLTPHTRDPCHPDTVVNLEDLAAQIAALNAEDLVSLGVETNILPVWIRGSIAGFRTDLEYIPQAEWKFLGGLVVASLHFTRELGYPKLENSDTCAQQAPARMLGAYLAILATRPPLKIDVIGHPFKHVSAPATLAQLHTLAQAAKRKHVALEVAIKGVLRSHGPIQWPWIVEAQCLRILINTGVDLYLGTDIHTPDQLEHLGNIQFVAQELIKRGVRPEQILNWEE